MYKPRRPEAVDQVPANVQVRGRRPTAAQARTASIPCTTPLARGCTSKRSDRGLNTTTRPGDGMQDSEHGTVITSLRTGR